MLLRRALREAGELNQWGVVIPRLPPLLRVEGMRWLTELGFEELVDRAYPAAELAECMRSMAPGAMCKMIELKA